MDDNNIYQSYMYQYFSNQKKQNKDGPYLNSNLFLKRRRESKVINLNNEKNYTLAQYFELPENTDFKSIKKNLNQMHLETPVKTRNQNLEDFFKTSVDKKDDAFMLDLFEKNIPRRSTALLTQESDLDIVDFASKKGTVRDYKITKWVTMKTSDSWFVSK